MGKDSEKKKTSDSELAGSPLSDLLPPGLVEKLPKEVRQEVIALFMRSGPMPHPLARVISAEHIDKIIENTERDAQRNYEYARSNRLAIFVISLVRLSHFLEAFREF